MPTQKKAGKAKVILFFSGFVLLFILAFALGVIIGKGLGGSDYIERKTRSVDEPRTDIAVEEDSETTSRDSTEKPETGTQPVEPETEEKDSESMETVELPQKEVKLTDDPVTAEGSSEPRVRQETEKSSLGMKEELELKEETNSQDNEQLARSEVSEKKTDVSLPPEGEKEQTPSSTAKLPRTDPGGAFTVQLGSFKNREMAVNLEKKMNARGYPSFVRKVVIPDKGTWYRVRIGSFKDKSKAELYADLLLKREDFLKGAYVTRND